MTDSIASTYDRLLIAFSSS